MVVVVGVSGVRVGLKAYAHLATHIQYTHAMSSSNALSQRAYEAARTGVVHANERFDGRGLSVESRNYQMPAYTQAKGRAQEAGAAPEAHAAQEAGTAQEAGAAKADDSRASGGGGGDGYPSEDAWKVGAREGGYKEGDRGGRKT